MKINRQEFHVLWDALAQFVENHEEDEEFDPKDVENLRMAEKLLERFDEVIALGIINF